MMAMKKAIAMGFTGTSGTSPQMQSIQISKLSAQAQLPLHMRLSLTKMSEICRRTQFPKNVGVSTFGNLRWSDKNDASPSSTQAESLTYCIYY
jgi:hypothetical protein